MYLINTMLSLILLVAEMLKIPRVKVEALFLKKIAFVTNKYLVQRMPKDNRKPFKIHSSTPIVACTDFLIFSYILQSFFHDDRN